MEINLDQLLNEIYFFKVHEKITKFQYNEISALSCSAQWKNKYHKMKRNCVYWFYHKERKWLQINSFLFSALFLSFPLCTAVYAAARKVGDDLVYDNIVTNSETLWLPSWCLLSYQSKIIILSHIINNFFPLFFLSQVIDPTWFPAVLTYKLAPRPPAVYLSISPLH